jgi:hypothetical protein
MIILDVEIKKAILGRGEEPVEGVEYCGGWRDFKGMGVACVCTFDIVSKLSRVFIDEDLQDLAAYLQGRVTAGFNTRRFDLPLLHEHGVLPDKVAFQGAHYDILEQIWIALGLNPDRFAPATHGGWSLDAVCGSTLGVVKSGAGALAPHWWQQGRRGRVIDYCLRDVWLEAQLLMHIIEKRHVQNAVRRVDVFVPPEFLQRSAA